MQYLKYIAILLPFLLVSCSSNTNSDDTGKKISEDLSFSLLEGIDTLGKQKIFIQNLNDTAVYIKKESSNWSEHMIGIVISADSSKIKIVLKRQLGMALCKSEQWGNPYLGISRYQDNSLLKVLDFSTFQVYNASLNIDTILFLDDMTSFYEMPKMADKMGIVELTVDYNNESGFIADTFNFNYYSTMICATSKLYYGDTLEIELLDSKCIIKENEFSIAKIVTKL